MDIRLYSKIYEHFKHLVPRLDFGLQNKLEENEEELTKRQKKHRLKTLVNDIRRSEQNADGSYDYRSDIDISEAGISNLEDFPQINILFGSFDCSKNKIRSLKGSPRICANFNCSENLLNTLEGAPTRLDIYGGESRWCPPLTFDCSENGMWSFEGVPKACVKFIGNGNAVSDLSDLENTADYIRELVCDEVELSEFYQLFEKYSYGGEDYPKIEMYRKDGDLHEVYVFEIYDYMVDLGVLKYHEEWGEYSRKEDADKYEDDDYEEEDEVIL